MDESIDTRNDLILSDENLLMRFTHTATPAQLPVNAA